MFVPDKSFYLLISLITSQCQSFRVYAMYDCSSVYILYYFYIKSLTTSDSC